MKGAVRNEGCCWTRRVRLDKKGEIGQEGRGWTRKGEIGQERERLKVLRSKQLTVSLSLCADIEHE